MVEIESVVAQQPHGQQSLIHVPELAPEAHERSRADHAGDLALEAAPPARLEQLTPEQEGPADAIGVALDRRSLALTLGAAPAGISHRPGVGLVLSRPDRGQERAVDDEVRVAADRRGEVGVGRAAQPGVAEVAL